MSDSAEDNPEWSVTTQAVRAGFERSAFGEHAEPIMTTSSFVFASAEEAARRFGGKDPGPIYSRFTNPTVQIFEKRLAAMEQCEAGMATASGMAATMMLMLGTLTQGDEIVASRNMFGSTVNLLQNFLPRYGIKVNWADGLSVENWAPLVTKSTKYLFLETPTNPLTEIADIKAMADLAHSVDARLAVDNCFCTPALQQPAALGADVIVHSATKYLDGQGRCVGGALVGSQDLMDELMPFMRSGGPCMSPFNAWVFLKGLETLHIRMQQHSRNAATIAQWLTSHPAIDHVYYPGLANHPQRSLVDAQQANGGGIVSFEVRGKQKDAWRVIDAVKLCSITANLGDSRTTITHPASTTHGRMSEEDRQAAGIHENLIRLAVGLEDVVDIQTDLDRALAQI